MNTNAKTTIKDVARRAGVSTQTISRVINDRPDVAPATRKKVLAVIAELGYHPNALARGMKGRSCTLGVVTAGLKYVGPSRTLNGITSEAEAHSYDLLLEELPRQAALEIKPILDSLLSHQVDGILWAAPEIGENRAWLDTQSQAIPVPIVFLNMQPRDGVASLSIDNYMGAVLATRHLLEKGHREIAHISGPLEWWEARERKRGWEEAMQSAGLQPVTWVEGSWSSKSGEEAANHLLDAHPEIEAVFSANDQMALAVLLAAHRRGRRIPQDLAVVGFDDLAEAAFYHPPLTTISQDQYELGALGVSTLVERIDAARQGKEIPLARKLIAPTLVVRETT